jgi:hypothetical protein
VKHSALRCLPCELRPLRVAAIASSNACVVTAAHASGRSTQRRVLAPVLYFSLCSPRDAHKNHVRVCAVCGTVCHFVCVGRKNKVAVGAAADDLSPNSENTSHQEQKFSRPDRGAVAAGCCNRRTHHSGLIIPLIRDSVPKTQSPSDMTSVFPFSDFNSGFLISLIFI